MNAAQQAKVFQARAVLHVLGFPAQQSNERSALCLLCLIDLRPGVIWAQADGSTRWRTHELMQWLRDHYDQDYAANTRETIRRQTLHQFIEAGLVLYTRTTAAGPSTRPQTATRSLLARWNCCAGWTTRTSIRVSRPTE